MVDFGCLCFGCWLLLTSVCVYCSCCVDLAVVVWLWVSVVGFGFAAGLLVVGVVWYFGWFDSSVV